jgi:hypothetical protein
MNAAGGVRAAAFAEPYPRPLAAIAGRRRVYPAGGSGLPALAAGGRRRPGHPTFRSGTTILPIRPQAPPGAAEAPRGRLRARCCRALPAQQLTVSSNVRSAGVPSLVNVVTRTALALPSRRAAPTSPEGAGVAVALPIVAW